MSMTAQMPTTAAPPRSGMTWAPGGRFLMGSDRHYAEEAPARPVSVDGFWIDTRPVTNQAFARFVEATGYVTFAETPPKAEDYPGALPEMLTPGSLVFTPTRGPVPLDHMSRWWRYQPGADWRHPQGPGSDLRGRMDHPVTHVAWCDVEAYANWAGGSLPSEAEWEYAARGGLDGAEYAWGEVFEPDGRPMANTWQGRFPFQSARPGGAYGTTPVGAFPPNGYGLYDMIGNVWEWTSDWWSTTHAATSPCCAPRNPAGGQLEESCDPAAAGAPIPRKVLKGGSHLCAPSYCRRYRPAARHAQPVDTSTSHVGFRLIVRPDPTQGANDASTDR